MSSSDGHSDSFAPPALWTARTQKRNAAITRDMGLIHGRLDELKGVTNDMNEKLNTIMKALAQLTAGEHINIPLTESTIRSQTTHLALRASVARMEAEMESLLASPNPTRQISTAEPESECSPSKCDDVLIGPECKSYEIFSGLSFTESDPDQVDHVDDLQWASPPVANEIPTALMGVEKRPVAARVPPIAIGSIGKDSPANRIPGCTPRGLEVCRAYNAQSSLFEGCRGADQDLQRLLNKRREISEGGGAASDLRVGISQYPVKRSPRWHFTPRGSLRQWLSTARGSHGSQQLYRMQPVDIGFPESLESIPLA